jgi:endonuclease-3
MIEYLRTRYHPRHRRSEPFRVLISTILSQRTRDENTEMASNRLFSRYATPGQIAGAPIPEIENLIRPAGFFKAKARHIRQTSSILIERYGGKVPSTIEELLLLPGVGQKTANCVLAYGFDIPALPVDVHVHRISNRIGIVSTRSPHQTEESLKSIFPEQDWSEISLLLIHFGRDTCLPRTPRCSQCGLNDICEYAKKS